MNLVKPSYVLLTQFQPLELLQDIERAGRVCYKSEERITSNSAVAFVRSLISRGHESVLEHRSLSVAITCDRGVSHELVRHRLASYSQESTRYCNYGNKGLTFVIPPWCYGVEEGTYRVLVLDDPKEMPTLQVRCNDQEDFRNVQLLDCNVTWMTAMHEAEANYLALLEQGWRHELARALLPNSLKTEVVMTANLREWRHVFRMRASRPAHPQMKQIMRPLLADFAARLPEVFEDVRQEVEKEY